MPASFKTNLEQVGIPVDIQPSEFTTMLDQLRYGQFQMTYGQWVGGNQDPIFYKDLFASSEIPTQTRAARNRSRYENKELDAILDEAANTYDHAKAAPLYARAQEFVSRDVPLSAALVPGKHGRRQEKRRQHSRERRAAIGAL